MAFTLFVLLVKSICDSCCGWLVDDTEYVETGDGSCVLGCLALGVVEVCRDGDYCVFNFGTNLVLGDLLHFGKNHS